MEELTSEQEMFLDYVLLAKGSVDNKLIGVYKTLIKFEKDARNNERVKYALELRDMDSHTAMDNIIETASKGESE